MFRAYKTELGPNTPRTFVVLLGIGLFFGAAVSRVGWFGWIGFLTVLAVGQLIRDRQRAKSIREFVPRMGFTFLVDRLPSGFPLHRSSSGKARSITTAFVGIREKKQL